MSNKIVVGYDGSVGSEVALRWARAVPLLDKEVVPAVVFPARQTVRTDLPPIDIANYVTNLRDNCEGYLDASELAVLEGNPVKSLVKFSSGSDLLVVGSRGHGRLKDLLLGSVSESCIAKSKVSVAVVPVAAPEPHKFEKFVVGVKSTEEGAGPVEWAIQSAPAGAEVRVVSAWTDAAGVGPEVGAPAKAMSDRSELVISELLSEFESLARGRNVKLSGRSIVGAPRSVLAEESDNADLLVLGATDSGRIARFLLGSVERSLVNKLNTPVCVIR